MCDESICDLTVFSFVLIGIGRKSSLCVYCLIKRIQSVRAREEPFVCWDVCEVLVLIILAATASFNACVSVLL